MEECLRLESVDVCYGQKQVLKNISFSLRTREILGIVGESGSGKSTIVRAVLGILGQGGMIDRGDIWFEGKNLPDLPEKEMRRIRGAKIGMIFQNAASALCPIRTIESQIYESMAAHQKITRKEASKQALALFEKLGFSDGQRILKSYPFELSGGMNQRVGIAVATLMNPSVLLADEPTSALDVAVQKQVLDEMLLLRKLYGTAIILVTHDIGVISAMADTVLVLKEGRIVEYGSTETVLKNPKEEYTSELLAAVPRLRRK